MLKKGSGCGVQFDTDTTVCAECYDKPRIKYEPPLEGPLNDGLYGHEGVTLRYGGDYGDEPSGFTVWARRKHDL